MILHYSTPEYISLILILAYSLSHNWVKKTLIYPNEFINGFFMLWWEIQ